MSKDYQLVPVKLQEKYIKEMEEFAQNKCEGNFYLLLNDTYMENWSYIGDEEEGWYEDTKIFDKENKRWLKKHNISNKVMTLSLIENPKLEEFITCDT